MGVALGSGTPAPPPAQRRPALSARSGCVHLRLQHHHGSGAICRCALSLGANICEKRREAEGRSTDAFLPPDDFVVVPPLSADG